MTTHPTPAERLLAVLVEDERAVETLPADEVRADLASVGVDPARAIALARALAGGAGSPGGQLLGAIEIADDAEDEIARLESADIDAVRARIPEGTAAAIAAAARRQAGEESGVVAMKPRRRGRILRWGGPVAGIAASLVVVMLIGREFLFKESYMAGPAVDSISAPAPAVTLETAEKPLISDDAAADEESKRKVAAAPLPNVMEKEADEIGALGNVPAPVQSAPPATTERLAKKDFRDGDSEPALAGEPVEAPAAGLTAGSRAGGELAEGFAAESGPAGAKPLARQEEQVVATADRARKAEAPALAAMLIVDPSQVPMKMQSQVLPEAGLAGRVDEARDLAGDRPVIALYRLQTGAAHMDFAQVPLQVGFSQQRAAPLPLTTLLGPDAANYDFILLPVE